MYTVYFIFERKYAFSVAFDYCMLLRDYRIKKEEKRKKEISEKKTQVKSLDTKPYVFCAFHF